ncbi:unnamed protein product [Caenorhabditis brenneri]
MGTNCMFTKRTLFNPNSKKEFTIATEKIGDFATVLGSVHGVPNTVNQPKVENLLELANRFQLPGAMRHLEPFYSMNRKYRDQLIKHKYQLDGLMEHVPLFESLSDETNIKLCHRALEMDFRIQAYFTEPTSIYKKALAQSDKTDAILVVDKKRLYVNKAVLSYHSDYFNTLFNSNFKEKSMKEIPIKDVNFEEFATLLSFFHLNPIRATAENAEKILELADRFLIPSAKLYVESSLISSTSLDLFEKMQFGEKNGLMNLFNYALNNLNSEHFQDLTSNDKYQTMSPSTKKKLFYRYLKI